MKHYIGCGGKEQSCLAWKQFLGPGSVLSDGGVFFPLHPQCYRVYVPFLIICPSFALQGLYLGILFGTTELFCCVPTSEIGVSLVIFLFFNLYFEIYHQLLLLSLVKKKRKQLWNLVCVLVLKIIWMLKLRARKKQPVMPLHSVSLLDTRSGRKMEAKRSSVWFIHTHSVSGRDYLKPLLISLVYTH